MNGPHKAAVAAGGGGGGGGGAGGADGGASPRHVCFFFREGSGGWGVEGGEQCISQSLLLKEAKGI